MQTVRKKRFARFSKFYFSIAIGNYGNYERIVYIYIYIYILNWRVREQITFVGFTMIRLWVFKRLWGFEDTKMYKMHVIYKDI